MAKKVTKKKAPTKKKTTKKKATSKKTAKTVAAAPKTPSITVEQIRVRAYEIYCSGQNPSNPDADWQQAEQELKAQLVS